jgi:hypothetical protein
MKLDVKYGNDHLPADYAMPYSFSHSQTFFMDREYGSQAQMRSYWNMDSPGIVKVQSSLVEGFDWSSPWAFVSDTYMQGTFNVTGFYRYYIAVHDGGFRWLEHVKAFDDYYVVVEVVDCPVCGPNEYQYAPCMNMWGRTNPASTPRVCMPCTVCAGNTTVPCSTNNDTVCASVQTPSYESVLSNWRLVCS